MCTYADYLTLGPYRQDTEPVQDPAQTASDLSTPGHRLIYVDLTNLSNPSLYTRLRADLDSEDVRVVILESACMDTQGRLEAATEVNRWLADNGFMAHTLYNIEVPAALGEPPAKRLLRRCAVYLKPADTSLLWSGGIKTIF